MANLNRVLLIGNLTKDPELRHIPSGTALVELRLAVSESYKNREGQEVESVCYVDVVVWARQAETCAEHLSKGSPVFVEGQLQFDQWEKDGEKRNRLCVRANRVQFMGKSRVPKQDEAIVLPPRDAPGTSDGFDDTEPPF
jgi:single-strand DNA-binding protein